MNILKTKPRYSVNIGSKTYNKTLSFEKYFVSLH